MKIIEANGDVWDANRAGCVPNRGLLLELGNPSEVARKQANHLINFRQDGAAWLYINDGVDIIRDIYDLPKLNRLMLEHYNVSLEAAINAQPYSNTTVAIDYISHTMTITEKTKYPSDVEGLPLTLHYAKKLDIDVVDRHVVPDEQYIVTVCIATMSPGQMALFLQPLTYSGGGCSDYFRQGIKDFKESEES